jgi:hypothetical protein
MGDHHPRPLSRAVRGVRATLTHITWWTAPSWAAIALLGAVGAGAAQAAVTDPRAGRHRLTAAQCQAEFDTWIGQDYRFTGAAGYTAGGAERYAAICQKATASAAAAPGIHVTAQIAAELVAGSGDHAEREVAARHGDARPHLLAAPVQRGTCSTTSPRPFVSRALTALSLRALGTHCDDRGRPPRARDCCRRCERQHLGPLVDKRLAVHDRVEPTTGRPHLGRRSPS